VGCTVNQGILKHFFMQKSVAVNMAAADLSRHGRCGDGGSLQTPFRSSEGSTESRPADFEFTNGRERVGTSGNYLSGCSRVMGPWTSHADFLNFNRRGRPARMLLCQ
jgi:hypothetical protein